MKLFSQFSKRFPVYMGLCLITGMPSLSVAQDSSGIILGGAGWMQYNLIGHSTYDDYLNGKSVLSTGAQISFSDKISDRLKIVAGVGIVAGNNLISAASSQAQPGYAPPTMDPFVSEADFTYAFINTENSKIWLKGGLFPYTYNPDVKDLGLYLLRGPVHPGLLVSGIETLGYLPIGNMTGLPVANIMGLQLHHQMGNYQGDLILSSETQYYPFFDISPVYVASYQIHPTFRIGAGVNFYHLIPVDSKLTNRSPQNFDQADSTYLAFSGTKLMATAAFDPKPIMKSSLPFGSEDLRLYGEMALIGLESSKAYRNLYGDYLQRMPVMMGFNIPVFNYLDYLSLEVEWYGAPFQDDMSYYNLTSYSAYPDASSFLTPSEDRRDNWKWALHTSKTIQKHVALDLQVANDHYRPGIWQGYGDTTPPLRPAVLVTPEDWYGSIKLSYCF